MAGIWDDYKVGESGGNGSGVWGDFKSSAPSGVIDTLWSGTKQTFRSLGADVDLAQGDNDELTAAARAQATERKDPRIEAFMSQIADWKKTHDANGDSSWWDAIKGLGSAAIDNPMGAALTAVEQLPNSLAAMGSGAAGAAAGSVFGPVGTVLGGIGGLFLANTALETGGKALEAAANGPLSDEQRGQIAKEGLIKGGVVTGIDVATLGATKFITGAARRAVDAATVRALTDAGVESSTIRTMQAGGKEGEDAVRRFSQANPEVAKDVLAAQELAYEGATTLTKRAIRGGMAAGLETFGEGLGEYLGEYAATGKADKMEALIEAFSSIGQSAGEIAATSMLNRREREAETWKPVEPPAEPTRALPAPVYGMPDGTSFETAKANQDAADRATAAEQANADLWNARNAEEQRAGQAFNALGLARNLDDALALADEAIEPSGARGLITRAMERANEVEQRNQRELSSLAEQDQRDQAFSAIERDREIAARMQEIAARRELEDKAEKERRQIVLDARNQQGDAEIARAGIETPADGTAVGAALQSALSRVPVEGMPEPQLRMLARMAQDPERRAAATAELQRRNQPQPTDVGGAPAEGVAPPAAPQAIGQAASAIQAPAAQDPAKRVGQPAQQVPAPAGAPQQGGDISPPSNQPLMSPPGAVAQQMPESVSPVPVAPAAESVATPVAPAAPAPQLAAPQNAPNLANSPDIAPVSGTPGAETAANANANGVDANSPVQSAPKMPAPTAEAPQETPEESPVFKTLKDAMKAARRLTRAGQKHLVIKHPTKRGKFTIQPVEQKPLTEKQIAARAAAGERLRAKRQPDPTRQSLATWLAARGGIALEDRSDIVTEGNKQFGSNWLFRAKGQRIDMAAEAAHTDGFLTNEEYADGGGVDALRAKIAEEWNGQRQHFSNQNGDVERAKAEAAAESDLMRQAEEMGIPTEGLTLEQIDEAVRQRLNTERELAEQEAQAEADSERDAIQDESLVPEDNFNYDDIPGFDGEQGAGEGALAAALGVEDFGEQPVAEHEAGVAADQGQPAEGNRNPDAQRPDQGGQEGQAGGEVEPFVLRLKYGQIALREDPAFVEASNQASQMPVNSVVPVRIEREDAYGKSTAPLYGAWVSNGDGTATWAERTFPDSKNVLSTEDAIAIAEGKREKNTEAKQRANKAAEGRLAKIKEMGIKVGVEWKGAWTYVQGRKGRTEFSKSRIVAISEDGFVEVDNTLRGARAPYKIKTDPDSRLFDNYPTGEVLSLTSQTPDDLRKKAEREADEAAQNKAIADQEAKLPLALTPDAPAERPAAPSQQGDMVGAKGLAEQPRKRTEPPAMGGGLFSQPAAEKPAEKPVSEMSPADLLRAAADKLEGKAPEQKPAEAKPAEVISDFGEKIGGAKKDIWASFKDQMDEAMALDPLTQPLSKLWPIPDYQAMLDGGADPWAVGFMRAARDAITAKPRKGWKVKWWAEQVTALRDTAFKLTDGSISVERAKSLLAEMEKKSMGLRAISSQIELYGLVGHSKSLEGVRISSGEYSLYRGETYNPPKTIWMVEKSTAATAFGNWPRELAIGNTKAEALAAFKDAYDKLEISPPKSKEVTFEIYTKKGENGFWIGKKVGRNPILLAGPYPSSKEARQYKADHQDELAAKLEKMKEIPSERRDTNNPRVGEDMRNGQDVTPSMFAESFGFRGVEFGNWVEQGRRQQDLNEAYDALMDMAAILDIPPRAISLNGELGLAFGARGSGGIHAAKAHYEPGKVVINLTKKEGAGSLGHEWWHALDNYFSRMRAKGAEMMTEALDVSLAARGSQFEAVGVRREMIEAFGEVMKAIRQTAIRARSARLDAKRSKDYWTTSPEMSARAFESYLISKLQDQNASNDYLANIVDEATWKAAESLGFELEASYPYPTAGEMDTIRAGFDAFFNNIETMPTDKGVAFIATDADVARAKSLAEAARVEAESLLSTEEKAEAARELGHKEWGESAAKSFIEGYADWLQRGAKDLGTKLSALYRKVLKAARNGLLSMAVALNINVAEVAKPLPVPTSQASITASVERPKADFKGVNASADAHYVADYIVRYRKSEGKAFIIADKQNGIMFAFQADGTLIAKAPALYGKARGDALSPRQQSMAVSAMTDADKITPAGMFNATLGTDAYYGKTLDFGKYDGGTVSIHRVYLGNKSEKRAERLATDTPDDNRISYGCINAPEAFMRDVIEPNFADGGMVVVLPETQGAASAFGIPENTFISVAKGGQSAQSVSWGSEQFAAGRRTQQRTAGRRRDEDDKNRVASRKKAYTDDRQLQLFLDNGPVESQAGKDAEDAQRAAVRAVDDLDATGSVLALALSNDYRARQRANLVGQRITSAEDLAVLAQVYRDPRFETFRFIFTNKSGKVVSQVGITSRLPGSTYAIVGDDIAEFSDQLTAAAKAAGATSYYLLHNHPSGKTIPSPADLRTTKDLANNIVDLKFEQHVIIDTNEYSTIDWRGDYRSFQKDFGQPTPFDSEQKWSGYTINSPSAAMQLAKQLEADDDAVTIVALNSQHQVMAISSIPGAVLDGPPARARVAAMRAVMRVKAAKLIAVGRDMRLLRKIQGRALDAIYVDESGKATSFAEAGWGGMNNVFPNSRSARISPDSGPNFNYLRAKASELMRKESSPGTQSVAEPDAGRKGYAKGNAGSGLPADIIRQIAERMVAGWANAPKVNVVPWAKVPERVRQEADKQQNAGATGKPYAFLYGSEIYIVSDVVQSAGDVMIGVLHEGVGHFGLRGAFGDRLNDSLDQVARFAAAKVKAKAAEYGLDFENVDERRQAAEEVLAEFAQRHPEAGFVKRAIAAIRQFLRDMGLNIKLSDNDIISQFIVPAQQYVRNGQTSGVMADLASAFNRGERAPVYYSELARQVSGASFVSAPPMQWKAFISSLKTKGVKPDEIQWSGVNDWLDMQSGKVTRDQVSAFLEQNGVKVEEVILGGARSVRQSGSIFEVVNADGSVDSRYSREDEARAVAEGTTSPTKFSQWQLPGGENYRELLLTLPDEKLSRQKKIDNINAAYNSIMDRYGAPISDLPADAKAEIERLTAEHDRIADAPLDNAKDFRSSHFDQPNILSHVRFNERTDAEGKRVLFIDEIQSDWAQKGKKEGFAEEVPLTVRKSADEEADEDTYEIMRGSTVIGYTHSPTEELALENARSRFAGSELTKGIPTAPFVQKTEAWVSLALKRMIRYAAENGFDRVAWATGTQQAERYDLSKQVDHIDYTKGYDGSIRMAVVAKNGDEVRLPKADFRQEELADIVGKEVADKIAHDEGQIGGGRRTLRGVDLKVGGEGMKAFYDKIVPNVANDVLKKLGGGRVIQIGIPITTEKSTLDVVDADGNLILRTDYDSQAYAASRENPGSRVISTPPETNEQAPQPGFDITPALRDRAMKGVPLFSRSESGTITVDGKERTNSREFVSTERAYGGRDAWQRAKDAGRTKLTYGQWVQVRTPAFKAWFGDWEAVRFQNQLDSMRPVEVTIPPGWGALSIGELRQRVADALNEAVLAKTEINHPELGVIRIGRKGERKTIHTSPDPAKLLITGSLERVIPVSIVGEIEPGDRQGIEARENLVARVRVGETELIAVISLNRQDDGRWYYNTSAVVDGEKDNGPIRVKAPPGAVSSPLGETPLTRAVENFIRRPFERVNPDTVSKAVDPDTGEPLVVYHGTQKGGFDSFYSNQHFGTVEQANSLLSEKGRIRASLVSRPGKSGEFHRKNIEGGSSYEFGTADSVYPAYLAIKNPKRVEDMGDGAGWLAATQEAELDNHDGLTYANTVEGEGDSYVAFRPEQIKSAIGNSGAFDGSNPDIRFARTGGANAPKAAPNRASWSVDEPSRMDNFIRVMQDRHIDTKKVLAAIRQAIGNVGDAVDVYLQEELFHGRSAKRTENFLNDELRPLLTDMAARGIGVADFEEYLHARHAEERNVQIAKVNPAMPDGGSGMDTADARTYLAGLDPRKRRAFEALAKRVDAINSATRGLMVSYGLESADTVKAWESAYKHYVPLQREDMEGGMGTGQGISIRGKTKRATGSKRAVVDILANIALQRERVIVRGEKNRVSNALVGLAASNPNPDFWKVDTPPMLRRVDERTGLVVDYVDPLYKSRDNVVMSRLPGPNGEIVEHAVVFNERDERAMRMARALKNLDMDDLGQVLGAAAKATRWFASINTQFNPIFGVVNLLRDTQGALLNLSTTGISGREKEVLGHVVSALRGIYIDTREARRGNHPRSAWAQLFEEFQREGGQTGFRDMFRTSADRAEAIERELKRISEGKVASAGRAVFDWLSDYNLAMENAIRLSAYKVAKDRGMSVQQAASLAKNLTVNFNRKGEAATQAGALYAFFNASMQGTTRLAETLTGPAGRKIIMGGLVLGSIQALLLAAAGFDDDEPPDFVRERNLVIPFFWGQKYLTVPMPLGFHVIPGISRIATEFALSGFRNPGKRATQLVGMLADTFNPIGNAGLSLQTIAPTVVDPLAALAENKDWTGKPIAREDLNKLAPTPGHTRAKDTASVVSKNVSKALNWLSGGTNYKPGIFSPTPDQIDYLIGQVTGGVGRELMKVEQTATSLFTGEDLPTHKIPLIGRFYGDAEGQSSQGAAFYDNLREINEHEAEIKGRRKAGEPIGDYMKENPEARLWQAANHAERRVRELRAMKRKLIERGASADAVKAMDDQITAAMRRFNDQVRRVKG